MVETRYADLHLSPPSLRVQTVGSTPGPPLGDNWTLAANLPASSMPSGAGQYAVIVTGKIGDVLVAGSTPSSGVMQVCLGTTQNLRLPHLRVSQTLTFPMSAQEGIPFQFVLVVSASDPDPVLGSSFTPDAGVNELVLWARTYLNGDPQTYYAEFTLADVSWLWFDLARIPSGDAVFYEDDTSAGFPVFPRVKMRGLTPAIGATGETWLHFGNVWYEPRQHLGQAPRFKMGVLPEGTPSTTLTCVVTTGGIGATGRLTAASGDFVGDEWSPGAAVEISGSALGFLGSGGNNSPPGTAQSIVNRAGDNSWIEISYANGSVAEGPISLTLTSWYSEPMVGSSDQWGMNQHPATLSFVERPQIQQGGFWPWVNTSEDTKAGFDAWEQPGTNPGAIYKRWRHLAIRIDTLPEVRTDSEEGPADGAVRLLDNWQDYYHTMERPVPDPAYLVEPIVMVHQVARITGARGAYGSRVVEASGAPAFSESLLCVVDAARGEAASSMAFGRRTFQPLSPAMQWRSHLVGSDSSPPGVHQVFDYHFVAFHPVFDPNNVPTPPGSVLEPIVLSPGKQGPAPASLPTPPTEPNANPLEVGENTRPQIRGGTGYRRSWPLGSKPVRRLSVTWGPLPEADALAVFEFLRDNPTWRYTPPRSADQSAMSTSRPVMSPASHRSFSVSIDVAILVWTGA